MKMEVDKMQGSGRRPSHSNVFGSANQTRRASSRADQDEEALRWAALEKLPTYARLRTSIIQYIAESAGVEHRSDKVVRKEVDVRKLDVNDRQQFIDRLFRVAEEDNERFLTKFRNRIENGRDQPSNSRTLPTLANTARNMAESALSCVGIQLAEATKLTILKDASGMIKPSRDELDSEEFEPETLVDSGVAHRQDNSEVNTGLEEAHRGWFNSGVDSLGMTLLLGPPSTFLWENNPIVGTGCKVGPKLKDLLTELARREKAAGIFTEGEVDLFMKATAIQGVESSLITDYTHRILGLDVWQDTIVGDEMMRGISGGQKKRVTTGEMIVGPTKTLFMDEISTGLDSSTKFQIVKCLQQIVHLTEATVLMSLLQPAPETFDLFDDIILLSEGQIVYQGPRENVIEFFESCGFQCPERKGTVDFLQE
ncbi:unnamed protein product [Camellia sinensis]